MSIKFRLDDNENEMVDIEQPSLPSLIDFDLGLSYELRGNGIPQGFYVTFRLVMAG